MTSAPHDAQKTLSDLRDHLARHDKPIAFLLGAGTSCAVRVPDGAGKTATKPIIPAVAGLTEICRDKANALGKAYADAWSAIENDLKTIGQSANVENVLSRLRMMLGAIGSADTLCGLDKKKLEALEECVRRAIAQTVTPDLAVIATDYPHRKLARWISKTVRQSPVEIFTVNYDVLIEFALETERVPLFDGFVGCYNPFFLPDSLRRSDAAPAHCWTRLWKMHGSVTWRRIEVDGHPRIVRGPPDSAGEMIYPSFHKYDESRQQPYAAISDRLVRFLDQDDALLLVLGFSFADEHINSVMFTALENKPRTHVYAIQFEEPADDSHLALRARSRSNLVVVAPQTGIIGGQRAAWRSADGAAPVSKFVHSKASGGSSKSDMMEVTLGDFAMFAEFLEAMSSR